MPARVLPRPLSGRVRHPACLPRPHQDQRGTRLRVPTNQEGAVRPTRPQRLAATYEGLTITEAKNVELGTDAGDRSPYNDVVVNGATITPRMVFMIEEQPQTTSRLGRAQGTTTVESYRTSLEKEPWKSQPSWSATLPSRYIFDVHLGSTLVPFGLREPWRAVLPIERQQLMDEQQINNADNGVRDWWRDVSQRWEDNKTKQSKLSLMENLDYQRKLSKQLNAIKHRVVYSKSGNSLVAARVT